MKDENPGIIRDSNIDYTLIDMLYTIGGDSDCLENMVDLCSGYKSEDTNVSEYRCRSISLARHLGDGKPWFQTPTEVSVKSTEVVSILVA
jgi:hypothetical protein